MERDNDQYRERCGERLLEDNRSMTLWGAKAQYGCQRVVVILEFAMAEPRHRLGLGPHSVEGRAGMSGLNKIAGLTC